MISSGSAVIEHTAITSGRALASNGNGIPVHTTTTDTELSYLVGVTSLIQTQLDAKVAGGGGSLKFTEGTPSPEPAIENGIELYKYANGLSQDLYVAVRVPFTYIAGAQIRLKALIYSTDSSNNMLMRTQSTLIRTGTDLITSTTNQRTSTNSAITLSGGTVSIPQSVLFDVTSTIGQVNAVAVSPGDLLIVRVYRDTDTSTVDLRFLHLATELSLT